MEPTSPPEPRRPARETRLLLLTVTVSVVVLLVLSRFRFPEGQTPQVPAAPPALALDQLAARATYDELAAIVAQVQARLAARVPAVPILDHARDGDVAAVSTFLPALRIAPDRAVALLPPGARLQPPAHERAVLDPLRRLALVVVPPAPEVATSDEDGDAGLGPRYVIAVEAGRAGPAFRPVFLPRADPAHDAHWGGEVQVLGGAVQVQPGALLFSLRGRFLGLAVSDHGYPAVVPPETLSRAAAPLLHGRPPTLVRLGFEVQPVDEVLARATGGRRGLLVSHVHAAGPASGKLQFGDVIQAVDGQPVESEEALRAAARRATAERPLRLTVGGREAAREVLLVPSPAEPPPAPTDAGMDLRPLGSFSEVVRVAPSSPAARAGLRAGDAIVRVGDRTSAAPAQVRRAFADAPAGGALLLGVERAGGRLAIALVKE